MKVLRFSYEMELLFDAPVEKHRFTIKCTPQTDRRQEITELVQDIYPRDFLSRDRDSFGNICIYGYEERPHERFSISVRGTARTGLANYEEAADEYKLGMYKYQSDYTRPGPALRDYFDRLMGGGQGILAVSGQSGKARAGGSISAALRIMECIYRDFTYVPGATGIQTTAEEAFCLGKGVCQDYSHIMIALLRMAGIPARYVVGMLIGEGLSHAWVEVCNDGMWIGLDPTNNLVVGDEHIRISCGRDYGDCLINQGLFVGKASQTQRIAATVKEDGKNPWRCGQADDLK